MSGILAIAADGAEAIEPPVVRAMFERLRHRGPDGLDTAVGPGHLLAHLHFWSTPEEVGERQPVSDPATGTALVLDGRIDNRDDLRTALGSHDPSLSDALLLLEAYSRWGSACFSRVLGPFAAIVRDGATGELIAARDPLGDRTAFYATFPGGIAIASEPHALRAHPSVGSDLDAETVARYFAVEPPRLGATFFRAIRELPPGAILVARGGAVSLESYFRPEPPEPIRYRRDEEYAEHLASVLGDAVAARLRSATPVGVTLSGGTDSTAVAALAVERLGAREASPRLASFSWVFDELAECDERRWILPVIERLGLDATYIPAEEHPPLRHVESWPLNPSAPFSNPYRRLKQALYSAAAGRGIRVLLVGASSEDLLAGHEAWLASRLEEGHWGDAWRHLAHLASAPSARPPWHDPALRSVVRRFLPVRRRRSAPGALPSWLTPEARRLVSGSTPAAPSGREDLAARRVASVFSELAALGPADAYFASTAGVELQDPFRDLRFVRFMLAVPPHQLRRGRTLKFGLRNAMRGRLPEAVVDRSAATPLTPFYRRSVLGTEAGSVGGLLRAPSAEWREYVDARWLLEGFPEKFLAMPDGRGLLLPWFAAASVLWSRVR